MGHYFRRTSTTGTLPRSTGSSISTTLSVIEDDAIFDSNNHRDTKNYKSLLDAFIILLQRDHDLLNYVFPNEVQSLIFTKLIEPPLAYMREEAKHLCESIEKLPNKLDTGKFAIYGIFLILRWFLKSETTFSKLYQVICIKFNLSSIHFDL